jgi:uncharacterized protein (DUF486 family)
MKTYKPFTLLLLIAVTILACSVPSLATRPTAAPPQTIAPTATWIASTPTQIPAPTQIDLKTATPAQVAETITRLFYTVDYQNPAGWLEAMRPYLSEDGVKIMREVMTPALFPEFERLKTKSEAKQVKVKWKKLAGSGYSESAKMAWETHLKKLLGTDYVQTVNMEWELHLVEVMLDPAINWPGKTVDWHVNALLSRTLDGWRFTTFFSDAVVKTVIAQPAKVSTPTK